MISFGIGENEISQLDGVDLTGDYLAWSYFESVDRPQNKQFVRPSKKNSAITAASAIRWKRRMRRVYLWARAVKAAGSDDVRAIRKGLQRSKHRRPWRDALRLDPGNNHAWKMFRMGKLVGGNHIEVVYGSDKLLSPDPFRGRTRAEWEALLQFLHSQWKKLGPNRQAEPAQAREVASGFAQTIRLAGQTIRRRRSVRLYRCRGRIFASACGSICGRCQRCVRRADVAFVLLSKTRRTFAQTAQSTGPGIFEGQVEARLVAGAPDGVSVTGRGLPLLRDSAGRVLGSGKSHGCRRRGCFRGRSSGGFSLPDAKLTARSMALTSSRMLPGQR